jgi:diaminohydroxyphosphoribosylaminopyrimidine deaminase/5-amino-6-(5-phosphoribosylamino)uracil reductase
MGALDSACGPQDISFMRWALRLARRGFGKTSPNPMVGAVLVRDGRIIGQGWHHRAGTPHAEIVALADAHVRGNRSRGAALYVTLEPCSTYGRTGPCTEAIIAAKIRHVLYAATDPNPAHAGRALGLLERAGIRVNQGLLADQAERLNEPFNHWIVHRTPFVTLKAAMSLDGKIATVTGESRWISSEPARRWSMRLRQGADAILVGINTVLADDPQLTVRPSRQAHAAPGAPRLRRFILDSRARTPLTAKVISDEHASNTTAVVSLAAPPKRVAALAKRVNVWTAPGKLGNIPLSWLLEKMGAENVTSLLVEGGGQVHASFLAAGLAQRVAFIYAPMILGGRDAPKAVAGLGACHINETTVLETIEWRRLGPDLLMTARVRPQAVVRAGD